MASTQLCSDPPPVLGGGLEKALSHPRLCVGMGEPRTASIYSPEGAGTSPRSGAGELAGADRAFSGL